MGKERRDRKNENIWTKFSLLSTFLLHFLSLRAGGSYVLRAPRAFSSPSFLPPPFGPFPRDGALSACLSFCLYLSDCLISFPIYSPCRFLLHSFSCPISFLSSSCVRVLALPCVYHSFLTFFFPPPLRPTGPPFPPPLPLAPPPPLLLETKIRGQRRDERQESK